MIELSREEILRYSRHLLIPEVGLEGQRKLKASSALVVGTGGLGSPVALYLAAAGVGRIGLVDFDVVDASNLQRQVIHGTSGIGELKVESARRRLLDLNPAIDVQAYNEPFTSDNAFRIAADYDILIDGTDNFPTRYLTNDVCVMLGKPNIYGSIYRFEGQASVFCMPDQPCYRCLFPEPPPPGMVPSCAEGGVLGVLPGTIGTIQATEALKVLLGIGKTLACKLMLYDALEMSFEVVNLIKNPQCAVCGENPTITELIDYEAFCGVPGRDHDEGSAGGGYDITAPELAERLKDGGMRGQLRLIDVREPHELAISALPGAENIPLGALASRLSELDSAQEMVVFCKAGTRSTRALELLASAGFKKVRHLKGGINAWAEEVDPEMVIY
jgi:adenylyltransferase/sulfurtransferase